MKTNQPTNFTFRIVSAWTSCPTLTYTLPTYCWHFSCFILSPQKNSTQHFPPSPWKNCVCWWFQNPEWTGSLVNSLTLAHDRGGRRHRFHQVHRLQDSRWHGWSEWGDRALVLVLYYLNCSSCPRWMQRRNRLRSWARTHSTEISLQQRLPRRWKAHSTLTTLTANTTRSWSPSWPTSSTVGKPRCPSTLQDQLKLSWQVHHNLPFGRGPGWGDPSLLLYTDEGPLPSQALRWHWCWHKAGKVTKSDMIYYWGPLNYLELTWTLAGKWWDISETGEEIWNMFSTMCCSKRIQKHFPPKI